MSSALKEKKKKNLIKLVGSDNFTRVSIVECLLDSPETYQATDEKGNNLLQIAILNNDKFQVFDYLVSIKGFPLELKNHQGYTALETALGKSTYYEGRYASSGLRQHYAKELIKNGANIHHSLLLHCAIKLNFEDVVRHLIENGVNLNEKDANGRTPLHLYFHFYENIEIILMLLCSGADPFIIDCYGLTPFDHAVLHYYDRVDELRESELLRTLMENLFYYTFDQHGKYNMPVDSYVFNRCLNSSYPLFDRIVSPDVFIDQVMIFCKKQALACVKFLLELGPDNLTMFIEKYPEVLREVLLDYNSALHFFDRDCFRCENNDEVFCNNNNCVWWKDINCEIFYMLIESELKSETIRFISNLDSSKLILSLCRDKISEVRMTELVCYFLSYGLNLHDIDLEWIYKRYGYCELFKICLHMDLHLNHNFTVKYVMARLIIDVSTDIQEYINNPWKGRGADFELLLDYCAHPKIQDYCRKCENEKLNKKLIQLPQVPHLVELARNTFRKYFIQRCSITTTKQFYNMLKTLPISVIHEKIITFETKLYP